MKSLSIAAALLASASAAQATSYNFSQITIPPPVGNLVNPSPTGDNGQALSINDLGQVLVSAVSFSPNEPYPDNVDFNDIYNIHTHAFTALPNDPGAVAGSTIANGINNSGEVVGQYDAGAGNLQGFAYSNGVFSNVDPFGDPYAFALAVSNNGKVTGLGGTEDMDGNFLATQGFILSGGVYTAVDAVPADGDVNTGRGINNVGDVDLFTGSLNTGYIGAAFYSGGTFSPINIAGSLEIVPAQMNDAGTIVGGVVFDPTFSTEQGFIDQGGVISLLNFPGSPLTYAEGINNLGDIVGLYEAPDGSFQAFLATPVPEPATWAMMLLGFGALGAVVRRRGLTMSA